MGEQEQGLINQGVLPGGRDTRMVGVHTQQRKQNKESPRSRLAGELQLAWRQHARQVSVKCNLCVPVVIVLAEAHCLVC